MGINPILVLVYSYGVHNAKLRTGITGFIRGARVHQVSFSYEIHTIQVGRIKQILQKRVSNSCYAFMMDCTYPNEENGLLCNDVHLYLYTLPNQQSTRISVLLRAGYISVYRMEPDGS